MGLAAYLERHLRKDPVKGTLPVCCDDDQPVPKVVSVPHLALHQGFGMAHGENSRDRLHSGVASGAATLQKRQHQGFLALPCSLVAGCGRIAAMARDALLFLEAYHCLLSPQNACSVFALEGLHGTGCSTHAACIKIYHAPLLHLVHC